MRVPFLISVFLIPLILSPVQSQPQTTSGRAAAIKYDLSVKVLPDARRLEVNGTMRIPAANLPRAFVEFSLSEVMQDLRVEVLKPRASAGPARTEKYKTEGGFLVPGKPGATTNMDAVYRVHPTQPFLPGEDIELRFSYSNVGHNGIIFYIGPEVTFVSAYGITWYPQISSSQPLEIGFLRVSVPAGEVAIAGGAKRSSPEDEAKGVFIFEYIHPTYFSFASGKYKVSRLEAAIPVSAYLLSGRENMPQYLRDVSRMLSVLEKEFGRYRFGEFTLVEVPRNLAQKAGFNAATPQGFVYVNSNAFKATSTVSNMLHWYGHEFSHEWWPHVFSLKRPGGRFLEESLAEYGGLRVVETIAGAAPAERYRRVGYEADPIYSALGYFKQVGKGIDAPLGDVPANERFRDVVYNKGFLVWDMLSREIGRQQFQNILRGITRRYAFKQLTLKEFWREIEKRAGRDLGWFYEQWFERTGAPEFQIMWKQERQAVVGAITQNAPYYRATLQIEIQGEHDQRSLYTVKVSGARTEFRLPAKFRVDSVTLDPHFLVLRWTPEYHAAADAARASQEPSPKP